MEYINGAPIDGFGMRVTTRRPWCHLCTRIWQNMLIFQWFLRRPGRDACCVLAVSVLEKYECVIFRFVNEFLYRTHNGICIVNFRKYKNTFFAAVFCIYTFFLYIQNTKKKCICTSLVNPRTHFQMLRYCWPRTFDLCPSCLATTPIAR